MSHCVNQILFQKRIFRLQFLFVKFNVIAQSNQMNMLKNVRFEWIWESENRPLCSVTSSSMCVCVCVLKRLAMNIYWKYNCQTHLTLGSCAVVVPIFHSIFSISDEILPLIISLLWCILLIDALLFHTLWSCTLFIYIYFSVALSLSFVLAF